MCDLNSRVSLNNFALTCEPPSYQGHFLSNKNYLSAVSSELGHTTFLLNCVKVNKTIRAHKFFTTREVAVGKQPLYPFVLTELSVLLSFVGKINVGNIVGSHL